MLSYSGGPLGLLPYLIFKNCLAMTGVSVYKFSVLRSLYLESGLCGFSLRTGEMDFNQAEEIKLFFLF